jgi:acyl-CoA synthetase (AMP-forming)/AMP-acid ligase II
LYITGRTKDLIIRHGKNYYPQDIESSVMHVEGILSGSVAAFGIEGDGETRVVVVAETRSRNPESREQMIQQIRLQCHNAFSFGPDDIRLVPPGTIPRTTSGKIRRRECENLYRATGFEERGRHTQRASLELHGTVGSSATTVVTEEAAIDPSRLSFSSD